MKPLSSVCLIAFASIAAFLLGGWTSGGKRADSELPLSKSRPSSAREIPRAKSTQADALARPKSQRESQPAEKAALLTPSKRVALMKKAAVLADTERQSDILCGLISAMTREELTEATKVLLDAQMRGNSWSQAVWNTLWTQWGRVNAEACLALSKEKSDSSWNGFKGLNTPEDYRCLMAGWLETHPDAAMEWARQAKDNLREATGAALAITSSAKGDLKQMESAILSVASDKMTSQACLHDYFDLAASTGDRPLPSAVYERLDPRLRAAAWPVVMERLSYTDPQLAATWLEKHAGDPGCNYGAAHRLVNEMAQNDPAGTAKWAAGLPVLRDENGDSQSPHPAVIAVSQWRRIDRAAADAWVMTQPDSILWGRKLQPNPTEAEGEP